MNATPNHVLNLTKPTEGFLCSLSANDDHGIEFLHFGISDYTSKKSLFEIKSDSSILLPADGTMEMDTDDTFGEIDDDCVRRIKYTFSESMLRLPLVSSSLTFSVGPKAVPNFRMIERHYFGVTLIKSYDFTFGFCIPNSTNTWDTVYNVPPLDDCLIEDMIRNPFETTSDSFYFVGDKLVLHNKAKYQYTRRSQEEEVEIESTKTSTRICKATTSKSKCGNGIVQGLTNAMGEATLGSGFDQPTVTHPEAADRKKKNKDVGNNKHVKSKW